MPGVDSSGGCHHSFPLSFTHTHTNTHSYSLTENSILRPLFEKQYFHIQTHYSGLWVILSSEMTSFPPQPPSTAPGGKLGFFLPLLANSFTLGLSIMQLHLGAVSTWTLFWKQMQLLLAYVQVPQQRCEKHSVIPPGIDQRPWAEVWLKWDMWVSGLWWRQWVLEWVDESERCFERASS